MALVNKYKITAGILLIIAICICSCVRQSMQETLTENYNSDYCAFFEAFPSEYGQFVDMYGYVDVDDDSVWYAPLYGVGYEHVEYLFCHTDEVADSAFVEKIIELSQNSFWEADACEFLRNNVCRYICGKFDIVMTELQRKSRVEQFQFWYFVFNSPHPNKQNFSEMFDMLERYDNGKEFVVADSAWTVVEKEWANE